MIMLKILTRNLFLTSYLLTLSFGAVAADWVYIVKQGDSLWSLAEDYMVDVRYWRDLQKINRVTDTSSIPPGTKLNIPIKWTKRNPSNARVTKVSGKVFVIVASTGKRKKLSARMKLKSGDEIMTAAGASATLKFGDGSILILGENSELSIEALEFYGNEDVFNSELKLWRGQTENKINPSKKPGSRFKIQTPSAVAAVRGTVYRVSAPSQVRTTTEVLEGKVQLANDVGDILVAGGFGTVANKGERPATPTALLPAPDLSSLSERFEKFPLQLILPELNKGHSYRVQIATDASFEPLAFNEVSKRPSVTIADLTDGEYFLKVRGIDENQLEGFDSTRTFVLNAKPEAPFLVQPQHDSAAAIGDNTFVWSQDEGITNYRFQLADNPEFSQPLVDQDSKQSAQLKLTEPLSPGIWFWRVAAVDAIDGAGPFGAVTQFRVMQPGPEAEQADLRDDEVTFRWLTTEPDRQYRVQVAADKTFAHLLLDKTVIEPHCNMPRPTKSGKIYMRTKVIEPDGFEGSWGRTQMLDIPDVEVAWKKALPLLPLLLIFL